MALVCAVSDRANIYGNESVFQQQNTMEILGLSHYESMERVNLGEKATQERSLPLYFKKNPSALIDCG